MASPIPCGSCFRDDGPLGVGTESSGGNSGLAGESWNECSSQLRGDHASNKSSQSLDFPAFRREFVHTGQGPDLLLRHLRGEDIDWDAVEARHTPSGFCSKCGDKFFKANFIMTQWKRGTKRVCKNCHEIAAAEGTPHLCFHCNTFRDEAEFEPDMLRKTANRKCHACASTLRRHCRGECGLTKLAQDFTPSEWIKAGWARSCRGKCESCMLRNAVTKLCSQCGVGKERQHYSLQREWESNDRVCIACTKQARHQRCLCKQMWPRTYFTQWLEGRNSTILHGKA